MLVIVCPAIEDTTATSMTTTFNSMSTLSTKHLQVLQRSHWPTMVNVQMVTFVLKDPQFLILQVIVKPVTSVLKVTTAKRETMTRDHVSQVLIMIRKARIVAKAVLQGRIAKTVQ